MVLIKFLWLWLQTSIHKAFLGEEEEEIKTREGKVLVDMDLNLVEWILSLVEEITPILVDMVLNSRALILAIKVFHLLFNLSLLKIKVNLVGLFVRYVERMVIQLLIVTIAWTLHIKEGMLLLNLPQ